MEKDHILKYLNDWNFWNKNIDTGIPRASYVEPILQSIKTKEPIIITGIRRSGKSTILLQVLKQLIKNTSPNNTLIVNLEDPRMLGITVQDMIKIYETYREEFTPEKEHYVLLDEVQNVRGWEKFVRYLTESKDATVFITGSNSKLLSSEFSTSLSGRYIAYHIHPLSFTEFLDFKGVNLKKRMDIIVHEDDIKKYLKEYLHYGGFPKIVLTNDLQEKRKLLNAYYDTIIVKDVLARYAIKEGTKLQELSRFLLSNTSSIISVNKMKAFLGLSLDSAQRFVEYLESTYLVTFVKKFDSSYKRQLLNPKKVYCIDPGMRNSVAFATSDDTGKLLENVVFLKLLADEKEIYYYKTTNNLEVDFAVKEGKKITQFIQVCLSISDFNTRERELRALWKAMEEQHLSEGLILTKDTEETIHHDKKKIMILPVWKWLIKGD
ncbi:MAG: ATP-binding protein [Candidatus Woesearchaeota archaeon]